MGVVFQLALSSSLLAQFTFEKAYRKLAFWPEIARSCDNDGAGGYVVATGEKLINVNQRTNALYRMNAYGDTLWYFTYPMQGNSNFQFTRKTKDGNFYVAGIEPDTSGNTNYMWWMIKVDSMGNFIWKKNYFQQINDFFEESNAMYVRNDGSLFLQLYDAVSFAIDTAGNLVSIQSNYNFFGGVQDHKKKNLFYADSCFYYSGYYSNSSNRIMKFTYDGDTISSIKFAADTGGFMLDLLKRKQTDYFTCSFSIPLINGKHPFTFSKFDSTGAKIWNKFYGFIDGNQYLSTTYKTLNNGNNVASFIPGTNGFNPPTGRAALFCFNDNGDSLWYKQLSPTDTSAKTEIFDVIATPDSGLLAIGQIVFNGGQQKSYVIKLDANGNLFNPLSIVEQKKESYLHIYPNPATNYAGIHYMGVEKNVAFVICNLQGKTIGSWNLSTNDERLTINTTQFSTGIYFCKIISKEGYVMQSKKLIVVSQ